MTLHHESIERTEYLNSLYSSEAFSTSAWLQSNCQEKKLPQILLVLVSQCRLLGILVGLVCNHTYCYIENFVWPIESEDFRLSEKSRSVMNKCSTERPHAVAWAQFLGIMSFKATKSSLNWSDYFWQHNKNFYRPLEIAVGVFPNNHITSTHTLCKILSLISVSVLVCITILYLT